MTTAKLATDVLIAGLNTALIPKFAPIAAAGAGNNTLVAAVTGKKIRVLGYTLVTTTAVTCQFQSGAGGTNLSGAMPAGITGVISAPFSPLGHFETAASTLLNLNLGGAVAVAGHLSYIEV